MKVKALLALAIATVGIAAQAKVVTGTAANGVTFTAESHVVGVTSTATAASGGNPVYFGGASQYRGTVGILMDYGAGGQFVCSGSLMADRRSILTAGHCVSEGAGTANPISTTIFFYDGTGDSNVYAAGAPGVTTRTISDYFVNSAYTGEVVDQNDIAVLRMSDFAPAFANAYELYTGDLTGVDYNIAGYGNRSLVGGAEGTTGAGAGAGVGRLRQGDNRYDFRLGDSDFGGVFTSTDPTDPSCGPNDNFFCGSAQIGYSYLSDFDNGLAANDASCQLATNGTLFSLAASGKYCNLGRGATEASTAGGDSGGPQFVNGMVASVTSYGLTFGTSFGDYKSGLQSSFGEFNGFVPVSIHQNFITSHLFGAVPEPATWAMMIAGFGMVGGSMRIRRRNMKPSAA